MITTLKKHSGAHTIIFCNSKERCDNVYNYITKFGYSVSLLTAQEKPAVIIINKIIFLILKNYRNVLKNSKNFILEKPEF